METFYLIDLDRTLLNTDRTVEVMRGVVALHDTELAQSLEQCFEDYTLLGESFSMRDYIVENVGEAEMAKIEVKFKAIAADQDLLNPSALTLLEYLRTKPDAGMGILTYGSPLGQAMKISAAGLGDVPFAVTSETFKGALIASWRQEDDWYHLPEEFGSAVAKTVVLVDDKPFSFKGLPIDCRGYLVKSLYDAGEEKLPFVVTPVPDLTTVIAAEKLLATH